MKIWIISSCFPSGTTICEPTAPLVFGSRLEAERALFKMMRDEWETIIPTSRRTGKPLKYPGSVEKARDGIIAYLSDRDHDEPWGNYMLSEHEIAGARPDIRVMAALAAAISLLERTPKAKKAAPSDKMFAMMLDSYRKALEEARAEFGKVFA
jgi:hypothetical protein